MFCCVSAMTILAGYSYQGPPDMIQEPMKECQFTSRSECDVNIQPIILVSPHSDNIIQMFSIYGYKIYHN